MHILCWRAQWCHGGNEVIHHACSAYCDVPPFAIVSDVIYYYKPLDDVDERFETRSRVVAPRNVAINTSASRRVRAFG